MNKVYVAATLDTVAVFDRMHRTFAAVITELTMIRGRIALADIIQQDADRRQTWLSDTLDKFDHAEMPAIDKESATGLEDRTLIRDRITHTLEQVRKDAQAIRESRSRLQDQLIERCINGSFRFDDHVRKVIAEVRKEIGLPELDNALFAAMMEDTSRHQRSLFAALIADGVNRSMDDPHSGPATPATSSLPESEAE